MLKKVLAATAATTFLSAALLVWSESAGAVSTRSFVLDEAKELDDGEMDGTAVHSDGSVTTSAEVRRLPLDDVATAWTFVRSGTDVFIGTGNEGKIYRLRGDDLSVFAETEQLLVSTLAAGPDGTLFAGTLPEAKIFRVDASGETTELTTPEGAEHIWALAWDAQRRRLYAATGPDGKLFTIDPRSGDAEVFWDSEAAHVMSLAIDEGNGAVYAGTSDEALVVRLRGPGRAEVVHDFPGNEITAITVRDGLLGVGANEFPDPPRVSTSTKTKSRAIPPRPDPGKGLLFRVSQDGRIEKLHEQGDGHITSVQIADDGTFYAGLGNEGRIVRVTPDRVSSVWLDVDERQVLDLDLLGRDPLFVTGDAAAVYRVVPGQPREATWTSDVLDADFQARFGELAWRGSGSLTFQTRSGNVEEPDETWSEWSAPLSSPGPIRSPAARFLQIRARFPRSADARLLAVTAYYLPRNQRPVVHDVRLKEQESKNKNDNRGVDDPPEPTREYELTWDVDNGDQDRIRYRLRFRRDGQSIWRDILRPQEILTDDEYEWDTDGIPDGWYIVQVEASDELSNPDVYALRSTAESEPLLIDNHPPRIEGLRARGTTVSGQALDGLGPIAKLEYAVDGGPWSMFFPVDDLLDTAEERFELTLTDLEAGEHIVAIRAHDAGGNSVTGELTVTAR